MGVASLFGFVGKAIPHAGKPSHGYRYLAGTGRHDGFSMREASAMPAF